MVNLTRILSKEVSNKIWNTTIKIPELKTTVPAFASSFDQDQVASLLTDMFQQFQGNVLVITGAASSHKYRQRYWSRSYLGWSRMAQAEPNDSHHVIASLMTTDKPYIKSLITQNVDHLHTKAGAPDNRLLELHGTLHRVECMDCGKNDIDRGAYQHRIHARNPEWKAWIGQSKINPDGDVELPKGVSYDDFDIPPCPCCGSQKTKPKVVFFGENIKPEVTRQAEKFVEESSAVVIIGSSLATYSSYRLVRQAQLSGKPIGIVTKGPTRADSIMNWKGEVGCTPVLMRVHQGLIGSMKHR
ncbi:DHS-like NAD/FAD-binding domain-containing protein [Choanephora cucurbitarum]|nr:DHS-like NAD/FAD-binding domain-containing protein [Choanephora cucurbitarum]